MKNKLSVLWIFLAVMVIGFLFAGCENPAGGDRPTTINYTLGSDGFYQFYTNDPDNYGYGYWVVGPNPNADHNVYEVECKKISGYGGNGYGMIFGASNEITNLYYYVLIETSGWYTIRKTVQEGTNFISESVIVNNTALGGTWRAASQLTTGYNKLNTIKVVTTATTFEVFFNNVSVGIFDDYNAYGNRGGFYTSIGSAANENFPNTPVDTRFRAK